MRNLPFATVDDQELAGLLAAYTQELEKLLASPHASRVKLILYWYLQAAANRIREENPACQEVVKDLNPYTIGELAAKRIQDYMVEHGNCPVVTISGLVDTTVADAIVQAKLKDGTLAKPK